MDWCAMDRLFEKGNIYDPKSKAKSVALTEESAKRSEESFREHLGKSRTTHYSNFLSIPRQISPILRAGQAYQALSKRKTYEFPPFEKEG